MKVRLCAIMLMAFVVFGCKDERKGKSPDASGKVLLRLNPEKGFSRMLTYSSTATANGQMMMREDIGMTITVDTVTGDADPEYRFRSIVNHISMESDVMGERDSYDSSKKVGDMTPSELEWHNQLGHFIDKRLFFLISSKGKIVRGFTVDGIKRIADGPIELNNFQIPFPEHEVGIGDSWQGEYPNLVNGAMVRNSYTVKEITDSTVAVSVVSTVPGIEGVMKENKLSGLYKIDRKTGILLEGTMTGDMTQFNAKMKYTFRTAPVVK